MPRHTLTSESFVTMPGGTVKPFRELNPHEKRELNAKTNHRLSTEMSIHYTRNREDYIRLRERISGNTSRVTE